MTNTLQRKAVAPAVHSVRRYPKRSNTSCRKQEVSQLTLVRICQARPECRRCIRLISPPLPVASALQARSVAFAGESAPSCFPDALNASLLSKTAIFDMFSTREIHNLAIVLHDIASLFLGAVVSCNRRTDRQTFLVGNGRESHQCVLVLFFSKKTQLNSMFRFSVQEVWVC